MENYKTVDVVGLGKKYRYLNINRFSFLRNDIYS